MKNKLPIKKIHDTFVNINDDIKQTINCDIHDTFDIKKEEIINTVNLNISNEMEIKEFFNEININVNKEDKFPRMEEKVIMYIIRK